MVFTISTVAVPPLLATPTHILLSQWQRIFRTGATYAPPIAAFAALNYAYVAYSLYSSPSLPPSSPKTSSSSFSPFRIYIFAIAATVAIVPFTLLTMARINTRLLHEAARVMEAADKGMSPGVEQDVRAYVKRWILLSTLRSALPLLGGVLGLWGAL